MRKSLIIQILLVIFIVSTSYMTIISTYGDTTTITETLTTVFASIKMETLDTTITSYITKTKTTETVIETLYVSMALQTAIVPTRIVTTQTTVRTHVTVITYTITGIGDFTTTTVTQYALMRRTQTLVLPLANARVITTYVSATILSPTTVTSWITSHDTIVETETITNEEISTRPITELITLTITRTNTSQYDEIPDTSDITGTESPSFLTNLSDYSDYLIFGLIGIIVVVVLTLVYRMRGRKVQPTQIQEPPQMKYCINCGKEIPASFTHCQECGTKQE